MRGALHFPLFGLFERFLFLEWIYGLGWLYEDCAGCFPKYWTCHLCTWNPIQAKYQMPSAKYQLTEVKYFLGGSGKYSKKLPITAYNVVGVAEMSWLYEYLDNMQRAPAQWHIKTVHLRRKAMHRGSKFQCSTLAKIRRVFEFCPI